MSNVEELSILPARASEYDSLVDAGPGVLDAIPGAVYLCDHQGRIVRYNSEAAELWGRSPLLSGSGEHFCGSQRLYRTDGTLLAHSECPMATAVATGQATRNGEVVVERPDRSRFVALVNIRALRDHRGRIQGAINCFQDISAHKAIEEEVCRKSTDLEDFFENSAIGLHIVSADGIIQRANRAELDLLGYSAEEYVGRHIADFHADAPVIGEILQKLSSGEKLDRYPARLRAKDGSLKHVLITSNSRFKDGRFVNTRCFTTDVTDHREAERARRDSEDRLAATYEAATIGIAETDAGGRMLRVNDANCEMLGRSRDELLSMSFLDYTHPEDREADAALYARQIRGELDSYALRKRASRPDGSTVYLDVYSSSVRDASGGFRYGVRVSQNVTEAKRMEDQIRKSGRHMRDLLEALPAAVYTTDAAGRITFYNKAAVAMCGRTPEPGEHWCVSWRLYTTDGRPLPHDQCPMALALKEDRPIRGMEAIAERPDGTRVPFIPYPTPLHDASGALVGAVNMLVDITDRKQFEQQERELRAELAHMSRVAAMGQIASALAHELNQPLAATVNYIEGCRKLLKESRAKCAGLAHEAMTQAAQQALEAGQILRRVREFVGRRHTEFRPENITAIVQEATSLALVGSKPHGATVKLQLDERVLPVLVDKTQLQQVVFNLVRNALQAMQAVERRELVIASAPAESGMVEISVSDTGPGIAEDIRPRLFQPFVTTKPHGMGIGLSICRTIIEAHGGRLWAEAGSSSGTTFRFTVRAASHSSHAQ